MKIKKILSNFKPYFVEDKPVLIRLDANESPYDLPANFKEELIQELSKIEINRYPDAFIRDLRKKISDKEGVSEDSIIFGNGSDEFIYMLYTALEKGAKVAYPEPGFSMYRIVGSIFEMRLIPYYLNKLDYSVDKKNLENVLKEEIDLIFLGNPNNPTGNIFPEEYLEMVLSNKNTIVVSDEAYYSYSKKTFMKYLENYDNLLVMRSFSKVGFASIRLGYMMGNSRLINKLNMIRSPYNINSFTQKIALLYFKHENFFKSKIEEIIYERERLFKFFNNNNIFSIPSESNFITFRIDVPGFYQYLLDRGIRIKDLSHSFNMTNYYRVTVGTELENDSFMESVKDFLSENNI